VRAVLQTSKAGGSTASREARRRTLGLALLAAGSVALVGVFPTTSPASPSKCRPAGSRTVAANSFVRVYTLPADDEASAHAASDVRVFGCPFTTDSPVLLGNTAQIEQRQIDLGVLSLSGYSVAYAESLQGVDTRDAFVTVRNLLTGKVRRRIGANPNGSGVEAIASVTDIELGRYRSVAWISTAGSLATGQSTSEVAMAEGSKAVAVLDEGSMVALHSLTLHGSHLTWSDGGETHSAQLR
jgi:hypothetical protein